MKKYILNKAQVNAAQRLSGRAVPFLPTQDNKMLVTANFAVVNMTILPMDIVPAILKAS